MGKVYFIFGVHNHQPVGNFPHIFEKAFNDCYSPFIEILEDYPGIKCNLHISGPLYEWIGKNEKGFIIKLRKMTQKGQLEIISGGYYEPILPLISDKDKAAQIKLMNQFIKKNFGREPRGIWIAERVWEPYLAKVINLAGLKYTFLDDTHFRYAGFTQNEIFGYYLSEESFKSIAVFPISKSLRYKIPFSQAHEAVDLLKSFCPEKGDRLVTLFDDGEKFGLWPSTYDWVYKKGWLKNFFSLLSENTETIETITAAEAVNKFKSKGIVYLPTASYEEMGEWVLEPAGYTVYENLQNYLKKDSQCQQYQDFVRGGFFRNFYRKYPRLNYMHKRMLFLSEKINRKGKPENDKKAFDFLWQGQCNCAYWHGIFGGFYLGHIRSAVYENLIKAENEFDKAAKNRALNTEKYDIDLDGNEETVLRNKGLICVFSPKGGTLLELSLRREAFNLLNTITRREESYHRKIQETLNTDTKDSASIHEITRSKEKNLDNYLIYDRYEKVSLVDHILDKDISLNDFDYQRKFRSLAGAVYSEALKRAKGGIDLIYAYKEEDLEFRKKISFSNKMKIEADYEFKVNNIFDCYDFGVEFNFFFLSPSHIIIEGSDLLSKQKRVYKQIRTLEFKDNFKKIKLLFKFDKADVFILPVYSVSSSESGFEKVYQQTTVLFVNRVNTKRFSLSCSF
ncbi:MAG: DUF1926 domain-containing protein [Candidatus Omnitrophica bacterium]|nr:DUF1926 domain-containing protein [Candidatus Omnitrophota bacterium]